VWQGCDSLSELICTTQWQLQWTHCQLETDRSYLATSPGILASTCTAFDIWLWNARVSGRGDSGPGRPSGMPRECTWIMATEEACSEGGCTSSIQILGSTDIEDLLASEQVVWSFMLRVGDCTGLLGATMEGITDGVWDRPQALDSRARCHGGSWGRTVHQRWGRWMTATGQPRHEGSTGRRGLAYFDANCFISRLLDIPSHLSVSIMNWELMFADGAGTATKMVPTDDVALILITAIYGDFVEVFSNQGGDTPATSVNWPCNKQGARLQFAILAELTFIGVFSWVELSWAVLLQLRGIRSCAREARSYIWIWTYRSHAQRTDWWLGIFLWWMICHQMDYGTAMNNQWKTDIMEVTNNEL